MTFTCGCCLELCEEQNPVVEDDQFICHGCFSAWVEDEYPPESLEEMIRGMNDL